MTIGCHVGLLRGPTHKTGWRWRGNKKWSSFTADHLIRKKRHRYGNTYWFWAVILDSFLLTQTSHVLCMALAHVRPRVQRLEEGTNVLPLGRQSRPHRPRVQRLVVGDVLPMGGPTENDDLDFISRIDYFKGTKSDYKMRTFNQRRDVQLMMCDAIFQVGVCTEDANHYTALTLSFYYPRRFLWQPASNNWGASQETGGRSVTTTGRRRIKAYSAS